MESIRIIPDLEATGFRDGEYEVVEYKGSTVIGGMEKGTEGGHPVVMIGLDVDESTVLVIQTTLTLFLTAADTLKAKYGDPRA